MGCYVPGQTWHEFERRPSWPDRPPDEVRQALATVRRQQGVDASEKASILAEAFRNVVRAFDELARCSSSDPFHGLATLAHDSIVRYDRVVSAAAAAVGPSGAGICLSAQALHFLECHELFFSLNPRSWDGADSSEAPDSVQGASERYSPEDHCRNEYACLNKPKMLPPDIALLLGWLDGGARTCAGLAEPPLVAATTLRETWLVRDLLYAGANPDVADCHGTTALMCACYDRAEVTWPDPALASLLCAAGGWGTAKQTNHSGETAAELVRKYVGRSTQAERVLNILGLAGRLCHEQLLAFAAGLHPRIGSESFIGEFLNADLIDTIARLKEYAWRSQPLQRRIAVWSNFGGPSLDLAWLHSPHSSSSASNAAKETSNQTPNLDYLADAALQQLRFFEFAVPFLQESPAQLLSLATRQYAALLGSLANSQAPTATAALATGGAAAHVTPSFEVEVLWRAHLLSPLAYARDCDALHRSCRLESGLGELESTGDARHHVVDHVSRRVETYASQIAELLVASSSSGTGTTCTSISGPEQVLNKEWHSGLVLQTLQQVPFMEKMLEQWQRGDVSLDVLAGAVDDYTTFLTAAGSADGDEQIPVPSDLVDLLWHTHMLAPRRYAAECVQICGRVLDHAIAPAASKRCELM